MERDRGRDGEREREREHKIMFNAMYQLYPMHMTMSIVHYITMMIVNESYTMS